MRGVWLTGEDFAWIPGCLCQLYRVPFDSALLRQQFRPPYDLIVLLAASLAIQSAALATPLLTQIVIDKFVVHHTGNALWGVALAMFMAFSAIMTWMRQICRFPSLGAIAGARSGTH